MRDISVSLSTPSIKSHLQLFRHSLFYCWNLKVSYSRAVFQLLITGEKATQAKTEETRGGSIVVHAIIVPVLTCEGNSRMDIVQRTTSLFLPGLKYGGELFGAYGNVIEGNISNQAFQCMCVTSIAALVS